MKIYAGLAVFAVFSIAVYAGGNPEFVKFPAGYKDAYTLYHTQNRANNKQVADLYANEIAVKSIGNGELANGSIVVMEIYKPEVDEAGSPVTGPDGVFKKEGLAAVAVMEKREQWDESYSAEERTGGWGFAIYDAVGAPKENDLNCVSCHAPLANQDYLFSFPELTGK